MNDMVVELIAAATCAIGLFAAVIGFTQRQFPAVSRRFAVFLLAVVLNNLPVALDSILKMTGLQRLMEAVLMLGIFSSLCLLPLFWFYVYALTSSQDRWPPRLSMHMVMPGLGLFLGIVAICLPASTRAVLFQNSQVEITGWAVVYFILMGLLGLALYPQLAVYLTLIVQRLLRYRKRLRDLYSSTEQHELRWIWGIGLFGILFLAAQVMELWLHLSHETEGRSSAILSLPGFAAFLTAAFWGLRQRPALVHDAAPAAPAPTQPVKPAGKYNRSALSPEAEARIERKLRLAMETNRLHRDPNLSLWALAKHIGATPNNVSQTLNDKIGESFFDFVNGYRISDAKQQLVNSADTVLDITYDVGFNSRSSFYTAFKRVTGQTPSAYRKSVSVREGSDDRTKDDRHT